MISLLIHGCKVEEISAFEEMNSGKKNQGKFLEKIDDTPSIVMFNGKRVEDQLTIDSLLKISEVIEYGDGGVINILEKNDTPIDIEKEVEATRAFNARVSASPPSSPPNYIGPVPRFIHPHEFRNYVFFNFSLKYMKSNGQVAGLHWNVVGQNPSWHQSPRFNAYHLNHSTQRFETSNGLQNIHYSGVSSGLRNHTLVIRVLNVTPNPKIVVFLISGGQQLRTILQPRQSWVIHSNGAQTWANGTARVNGFITGTHTRHL